MKHLFFLLLALSSFNAMSASSKVVTCSKESSDTMVMMRIYEKNDGSRVRDNELLYLKINGDEVFDQVDAPVVCKDAFSSSGNRGDYCVLGRGYTAHVHLSSYIHYSGVILYKNNQSVDDDIHLECDF